MFLFPSIFLPTICEKPPTLYSLLNSIVNFDEENKTKIKNLAAASRTKIFDFNYPLSTNVNKEEFEILIINKFIMRRIAYETFTAWQIALNVKLNEIMPSYNKLFDMLAEWDLFADLEVETRNVSDTRNTYSNSTLNQNTTGTNTSDRRYSELPHNQLSDLRDGTYVTDYNYDTDTSTNTGTTTSSSTINDGGSLTETKQKDRSDKIKIYKEYLENRQSIYTMIFKDLDSLFYGLE